jgi:hypothetical protein
MLTKWSCSLEPITVVLVRKPLGLGAKIDA